MSHVQRWGNSLAVRLPKAVAEQAGLREGAGVTTSVEEGTLVIRKRARRTTLADLLRDCRDDNRHEPVEWGPPVGREGAKVAVGGNRVGNLAYFVAPTVLENTSPLMKVIREEIFGPVVCTTPFDDDDLDAIAQQANDTIYGLAASVWTRNGSTAHKLARRIRSGTVWINCHNVFDASLPFGGYKQSGWGREMGEEVLHNYTEIKAVTTAL